MEVDSLKKLLEKKKPKILNSQDINSFLFISSITVNHARIINGHRGYERCKAQKKTALYFFEVIADHKDIF